MEWQNAIKVFLSSSVGIVKIMIIEDRKYCIHTVVVGFYASKNGKWHSQSNSRPAKGSKRLCFWCISLCTSPIDECTNYSSDTLMLSDAHATEAKEIKRR